MKKRGLSCGEDNLIYGGFWSERTEKLARNIAYSNAELLFMCMFGLRPFKKFFENFIKNGIRKICFVAVNKWLCCVVSGE